MVRESPRLSQLVQSFLIFCESKNLSPETVNWYKEKLTTILRLTGDVPANTITTDHLRQLVVYWAKDHRLCPHLPPRDRGTGLAPNTINGYLRALKTFFNFLVEEGILAQSPAKRIPKLKTPLERGTVLTTEELSRLIQRNNGNSFTEKRNRALLILLADTGIRIGELTGLKVSDIDWGDRTLSVMGKGRKTRSVPFGRQAARALSSYLSVYPSDRSADSSLFLNAHGDPLTLRRAQHIVSAMAIRAGITDRRISPHAFRRTFATLWISNGGDPFSLQRLLGHTTMEMVNRYVRLSTADLRKSHAIMGPIDRLRG
jgi:integrase/recombinase XerD